MPNARDGQGPHSERGADDRAALSALTSLQSYFSDLKQDDDLGPFSGWLRSKANAILKDGADGGPGRSADLLTFGRKWLIGRLLFGPAAEILALAQEKHKRETNGRIQRKFWNLARQQQALATYKNEERAPQRRYKAALKLLESLTALQPEGDISTDNVLADEAETWALRGAIHRRLFDLDSDLAELHLALDCYRCSDDCDDKRETPHFSGYGALNVAFLLDALAFRFESIGPSPILTRASDDARAESAAARERIIARLNERLNADGAIVEEWLCETIAGACLGLGLSKWRSDPEPAQRLLNQAREWANKADLRDSPEWSVETTHAQWLRVVYLNEPMGAPAEKLAGYWAHAAEVINAFRHRAGASPLESLSMARSARLGKVGLALSGGGFRASFYHIGVLARLAEVDVLRYVDVLSSVSGGSLVGAHYYLLLRDLLESNPTPSREDYIQLVEQLRDQFTAGVNANLRMLGLSNPLATIRMLRPGNYTRSDRMAELYGEHFYNQFAKPAPAAVRMQDLRIVPAPEKPKGPSEPGGEPPPGAPGRPTTRTFNPRFSNWRRAARVPALLINATCLNTGHSWHFTANWMGEPPELIGDHVDKNERLRRMPYSGAGPYENISVGMAVAASACVPGIFEPVRLAELYPGRLVRLVDGGVHDNQGVDALIGQGCDFILCSDASGQMGDENTPPNGPVSTPNRSMSILMKRVRESEHGDLEQRLAVDGGRNLFFVHLKAGLPVDNIDWVNCEDPTRPKPRDPPQYGVDHEIQRLLSQVRTDLDSFSEVEASCLAALGYRMACEELKRSNARISSRRGAGAFAGLEVEAGRGLNWSFLRLMDTMALPPDANSIIRNDLCRQLKAGESLFFKNLKLLSPRTYMTATIVGLVLILAAGIWAWNDGATLVAVLKGTIWGAAILMIVAAATSVSSSLRVGLFERFFALAGLVLATGYFCLGFNRSFLERGSVDRLLNLK